MDAAEITALLIQPRIRFPIADAPDAGKTIMAGLTIKELKFRGLVRNERSQVHGPAGGLKTSSKEF